MRCNKTDQFDLIKNTKGNGGLLCNIMLYKVVMFLLFNDKNQSAKPTVSKSHILPQIKDFTHIMAWWHVAKYRK